MNKFITLKLKDIGPVRMCKRVLKSQTCPKGDVPFYKIKTFGGKPDAYISNDLFEKYRKTYHFPKIGSILISAAGTLGRVVRYNGEKAYFQDSNIVWIENDEKILLNDYLYYFYLTKPWQITLGSTIPRLYNNDIENLTITFPKNIEQQKKVVAILKDLDMKIATNNAISKELESMAKTIYDYWFLQFEFPDKDGKPYKSNGGKMVWNDQLKQKIPENWKVKNIFECADVQYGKPLSTKLFEEKGTPVIRIRDINTLSNSAYTQENIENKYLSKAGDLLIGMDGNFQMNFWPRNGECVNQRIVRIRKKSFPLLLTKFQIEPYIKQKVSSIARSTVGHLKANDIQELKILLPADDQLDVSIFDTFLQKIITIDNENKQLISLRNFLLPMLMNGQITIKD